MFRKISLRAPWTEFELQFLITVAAWKIAITFEDKGFPIAINILEKTHQLFRLKNFLYIPNLIMYIYHLYIYIYIYI